MTVIRVKGFQIFRDRHGKTRCYHRKSRTPVDLHKAPLGSAEFFAECARISQAAVLQLPPKPGTVGMLLKDYKQDRAFTDLAPRTRSDYQRIFDYLRPIESTPLVRFDRPLVVRIRDKAGERGRRFGNYVKAVLSILFAWGLERNFLQANPAARVRNIRKPKGTPDANRPWTDGERHVTLDHAPKHLKPALALMMFTGLGPSDALKLPRTFFKAGEIATRRSKTGEPVYWPAPKSLKKIIGAAPTHDAITLCANARGKPWTESGFRASWRTYRMKLEKAGKIGPGLTLYGLRHTVAVILREAGFDERTIADALGQKTIEMARHYARGADLKPKMKGVVKAFEREVNKRRTKLSNPARERSNRAGSANRRRRKHAI
ncbi:MAG: tyrosine-type recombinase/integrase [Bradyrhizobiaceae bacterium]|nr:tyrosine-type recombinase/integrase [Bradyrhizobiaceae bacterium]